MLELVVGLVMLVGLAGTVLPFVPGVALIWVAALVYGLLEGFGGAGTTAMVAITAFAIVGGVAGFLIPYRRGVAGLDPSTRALAAVLGIVGFFVVPVIGFPLGVALGVTVRRAERRFVDVMLGVALGMVVEGAAGAAMIATWIVWLIAR